MKASSGTGHKRPAAAARVAAAAAALMFLTSCGSAAADGPPAPTVSSVAGSTVGGFATSAELATDAQGRKFVKTVLAPGDSLFTLRPEQHTTTAAEMFTAEEIRAAQEIAYTYAADEFTDSILKGDDIIQADKDLWWESVKDRFDPRQAADFIENVQGTFDPKDPVIYMNPGRKAAGYELPYDNSKIQLLNRQITPTKVIAQEKKGHKLIGFKMGLYFELPVLKDGEPATEKVTATGDVILRQMEPGVWKISGIWMPIQSVEYSQ